MSTSSDSKFTVFVPDPYHTDAITLMKKNETINAIFSRNSEWKHWHDNADALLIRSETKITSNDFDKAKKLKVIVKQGVGIDNIDLDAAKTHGVAICNTPALNGETVAELTIALALVVARRICEIDQRIRKGEKVIRSNVLGRSLFKKCIGIIGMGNVGKEVARKWIAAMNGSIVGYDPFAPDDTWEDIPHHRVNKLEDLLRISDVVTLHVPLTSSTKGMIGTNEFEMMKKDAILLNCARGGIVDEQALFVALKSGMILGAGLDAMDFEPPTIDTYGETLLSCDNVVLTPHIGGSTIENQSRSGMAAVETLLNFLEGKTVSNRLV